MIYRTLDDKVFCLELLNSELFALYADAKHFFYQRPSLDDFANFWKHRAKKLRLVTSSALYIILQDMENRIAIVQKQARLSTWTEKLEEIINRNFKNRRDFCNTSGIDESHLSHVLSGSKELSMGKLEEALALAGFQILFVPINPHKIGTEE